MEKQLAAVVMAEDRVYAVRSISPLEARAVRQMEVYWQVRAEKTLERLERESRRMLQLEADLSAFADYYYREVGEHVERLNALEARMASVVASEAIDEVLAQRDSAVARTQEVKSRYRALAKEAHPDRAGQAPAISMQLLNDAYALGDLPRLLRLEGEVLLARETAVPIDERLRQVERAADTYAEGYRQLLSSPMNELMLRHLSAQEAGWSWIEAVVQRLQASIAEAEQALGETVVTMSAWQAAKQVA